MSYTTNYLQSESVADAGSRNHRAGQLHGAGRHQTQRQRSAHRAVGKSHRGARPRQRRFDRGGASAARPAGQNFDALQGDVQPGNLSGRACRRTAPPFAGRNSTTCSCVFPYSPPRAAKKLWCGCSIPRTGDLIWTPLALTKPRSAACCACSNGRAACCCSPVPPARARRARCIRRFVTSCSATASV